MGGFCQACSAFFKFFISYLVVSLKHSHTDTNFDDIYMYIYIILNIWISIIALCVTVLKFHSYNFLRRQNW